ncbi:MAG: hypothetical protein U5N26_06880 [Candidatus Marinimicrobia bacterium]|nr:hypothetical protein [Candidatus Neomarinimicrobiota bacterium]
MNQRETAKNNVLNAMARARLQEYLVIDGYTVPCKEGWVPGHILTHPSIGGEAGKRRKRELDEEGWIIEKQKIRNSTGYEYRLICTKHEGRRIIMNNSVNIIPQMIYGQKAHQLGVFE